jgi:flagellin-like hook-associated protein FlgL
MNRYWRRAALGLFFASTGIIQAVDDPPKKDDPPAKKDDAAQTPAEKFAAAKKANEEAEKNFNKVIAELQKKKEKLSLENKELNEAFQARNKATQAVVKAAEAVAKEDPTSANGLDAMIMVINNGGPSPAILKLIAEHHATNPKILPILDRLAYGMLSKEMEDFLTKVMEKNPSKDAQGKAAFALASLMMRSRQADAEKLFEKIMTDYKDVKTFNSTLGARAEGSLFEIRNLSIGKVVPDIEGEDVDGKKFKISDYRGKVVMLDFWGHW